MTQLIAICGVDGAGKSTLLRALAEQLALPDSAYVAKERRTSVELLSLYGFDESDRRRNWISGTFAQCAAIATVFDFMYHYDQVILPAVAEYDYVICDRYKQCYEAYLAAVGAEWPARSFFQRVRPADLILHLDLPAASAVARYDERGGAGEDENEEVIARFGECYRRLFNDYAESPVVQIDATQSKQAVYRTAATAIGKYAVGTRHC